MYERILFPTDGSEGAEAVIDHVLAIAAHHGATLHLLHVADTTAHSITRVEGKVIDAFEQEGKRLVDEAAQRASDPSVEIVTDVVQGAVPESIVAYADEFESDLITMATYGRTGLEQRVIGSITERVVRQAPIPVFTLPPEEDIGSYPYQRLLVPFDGSPYSRVALEQAIALATGLDAALHVLSVVDPGNLGVDVRSDIKRETLEAEANELVTEAASVARGASLESVVEAVETDTSVSRAIRSYAAENDLELVVMGTRGRTGIDRYLLGSVTERTVRTASLPVLTVSKSGE